MQQSDKKLKIYILAFMFCFLGLSGCSRLTSENYQKIELGMTMEEVAGIFGDSDVCDSTLGATSCMWGNDKKNIRVKFVGDKVVFYSSEGL